MYKIITALVCSISNLAIAGIGASDKLFYFGAAGGYGSTTWAQLVPAAENRNFALDLSAPVEVTEGGSVWGVFAGYEFAPGFAAEVNYLHFPRVNIAFDENSLFSFTNDGATILTTATETVNLMARIMLNLPNTPVRIYSALGPAGLHRNDILVDDWKIVPTFGAGANWRVNPHFMLELAANYTAGYGESQLNPAEIYFPFLYAVYLRAAITI